MMGEELNNGGRGFNIVIVDPDTSSPTSITHVDTYTYGKLPSNEKSTATNTFMFPATGFDWKLIHELLGRVPEIVFDQLRMACAQGTQG